MIRHHSAVIAFQPWGETLRILVISILLVCLFVEAPLADVFYIFAPDTVVTGEVFAPLIIGEMPSSCWYFGSMETREEAFTVIVDVSIGYENFEGGMCLGPTEPWELNPEFVFDTPGLWTLRVVEHRDHPGLPDYPDGVWETEVVVTGPVTAEQVSFGQLKAIYR